MALADNLISYWKLDEALGNAADSVAANTLTNNGIIVYVAGKINNCADLEYTGNLQWFSITDAAQAGLDITGDLSISLWINFETIPSVVGGAEVFVSKYSSANNRSYAFFCEASDKIRFVVSNDGSTNAANRTDVIDTNAFAFSTGTWYHMVVTFKASTKTVTFYINDSARTSSYTSQNASSIYSGNSPFEVGSYVASGQFDGKIDEVGIWSKELTSAEVTSLYNGGSGLQYPFTTTTAIKPGSTLLTLGAG